jgi:3-deoxy-D-manno-oct-2-ulosonic acid (Kdo) hydroxylase
VGLPRRHSGVASAILRALRWPGADRSPYDRFMHRFHNFIKENERFQAECPTQRWEFPPDSTWLVFTDMVSHAVLEGQYALEQTFIVSREAMVSPEKAPVSVLERLAGYTLTSAR